MIDINDQQLNVQHQLKAIAIRRIALTAMAAKHPDEAKVKAAKDKLEYLDRLEETLKAQVKV